jgi:hypothetical protein
VSDVIRALRRLRAVVRYRREVDNWRNPDETDHHRHCLDVLFVTFRFERQTHPDERWHFMVMQRTTDGLGVTYHGGWATKPKRNYFVSAHLDWWFAFSMHPVYKVVYADTFVQCWARLTGKHPIRVAEEFVEEGREIVRTETRGGDGG